MQSIDGEAHSRYRKILKRGYAPSMMISQPGLMVGIAQTALDQFEVGETTPALYLLRLIVTGQLGMLLASHAIGDDLQTLITATAVALNVYLVEKTPKIMLRHPKYQRARRRFLEIGQEILDAHDRSVRADLISWTTFSPPAASRKIRIFSASASKSLWRRWVLLSLGWTRSPMSARSCFMRCFSSLICWRSVLPKPIRCSRRAFRRRRNCARSTFCTTSMMETLRRYPIAPAVTRIADKDFEFAGCEVKAGQKVMLASTVAHFLPELYADPLRFDVTRYHEPRNEHKQRGAYAPFGVGTHTCLGAGAAELQIGFVMASLLHMVRIEAVDPLDSLPIKSNPTLTLGYRFRVRIAERRHRVAVDPVEAAIA